MRSTRLSAATSILIIPLVLSACATLNEAECQTANWRDLGQRDGQQGRASSYIVEHEKACARYGTPVDGQSWRAGWEVGIRQFCSPQNGLQVGREGKYYAQSCPADVAPGFLRTYAVGKRVYDARTERDRIRSDIDDLNRSVTDAKDDQERSRLQTQLILKQNELYLAQQRLTDAELEADRLTYQR
ncbi:DUF2799 domain-containing protein [Hoeflea sp. TYP-13]|uniref:DUF2799 domain-containing protein n=1 Tax=Hoeflea sp. TYP-13 TaxID=3230023 RepID=UPI0034C6629B